MECLLKDLTIDGKGSYGIGASAVDYDENKYTYLRITDINDDGTLNFSGLKSVDDENAHKYLLKENDIVFARTGASTGRSYFYQPQDGQFVYAGFLIKYSLDPKKVNPRILKYYTHSKDYYDWVKSFDTGGTRGNINAQTFANMPLSLPERAEQDKIVSILSSLDSKIETNNKINAKLEEMAQAFFKSWFVDFEPFKDKGMVESELGMIPDGWRVGKLGDIAVVEKKSINPLKQSEILFSHYSLPAYDESKLPVKQYGSEIMSNKFMFNNRTTLLSKLNPHIKRIWYVEEVEENAICSTEFLPFKSIDDNCSAFLYSYLVSDSFYKVALSMVQGATNSHQRLDAKSLLDFDLAINEDAMKSFNDIVAPMLMTICKNRQENLRLSLLRDTLLPKLMSGEIEL